jgi:hypothetical protein
LEVVTTYKGFDAEWIRTVLAEYGRDRLQKSLLNDYAQLYPDITPAAAMVVEDDPNQEWVAISHNYTITNFWTLSTDKEKYTCTFFPSGIQTWITKPTTTVRTMPMELAFPRRRLVQTHVILPSVFQLTGATNAITGPATELKLVRTYNDLDLRMSYEYNALTNYVPATQAGEHIKSLTQMGNALGYILYRQNGSNHAGKSQFNWPIFFLGTVYTVGLIVGMSLLYRRQTQNYQPPTVPPLLEDTHLNGLKGWLILIGIGLLLGPFRTWNELIVSLDSFTLWKWHALTQPGALSYHPGWKPLLLLQLFSEITIGILNLAVIGLFFAKRHLFPRWCIAYWVIIVAYGFAATIGLQFVKPSETFPKDLTRCIMQLIIFACIWIPYLYRSRRVNATFVR